MKRRNELTQPRSSSRFDVSYDSEQFGHFAESIANFLGTARFLVWQTVIIVAWIGWNLLAPDRFVFDSWGRGFVLLTLLLSVQASYAAPLILLAQNRQERRDRQQSENDRQIADRTKNDTEFLAREIAGVRLALNHVPTTDELESQLREITESIRRLSEASTNADSDRTNDQSSATDSSAPR